MIKKANYYVVQVMLPLVALIIDKSFRSVQSRSLIRRNDLYNQILRKTLFSYRKKQKKRRAKGTTVKYMKAQKGC